MNMNYWKEPYPLSMDDLTEKCESKLKEVLDALANDNCKTLGELYKEERGETTRLKGEFEKLGYKPNTKLNSKAIADNELKGIYVFAEIENGKVIPRYVGISGTIFRRLRQHGWGKLHNEATLAYLKASSKSNYNGERRYFPYSEIEKQQKIIRQYKVALLPEALDFDLYFMEVYFSGRLKTLWNSFKTH
jgi:hypothetical protein